MVARIQGNARSAADEKRGSPSRGWSLTAGLGMVTVLFFCCRTHRRTLQLASVDDLPIHLTSQNTNGTKIAMRRSVMG